MKEYLGLGKTLYSSSVCHISSNSEIELLLNERLTRKKANGSWPELPLSYLKDKINIENTIMSESRDVIKASLKEKILNQGIPFFEYLESKKLERYTKKNNSNIEELPHHFAHAMTALAMSPFSKSIIVVVDGAGSKYSDFADCWSEKFKPKILDSHESATVYLQDAGELVEVEKKWQKFESSKNCKGKSYSNGIGTLYEIIAEYIFGSNQASGKVMGLAAFGDPISIIDHQMFLEELDWTKSYKGTSKEEWESSPNMDLYKNLAATAQLAFENYMQGLFSSLKEKYPDYTNVIVTGGCALNCSYNAKLVDDKFYKEIYIPPFPGDCGISFGLAHYSQYKTGIVPWVARANSQHGYYGPIKSIPENNDIEKIFNNFKVLKIENKIDYACELLEKGKVIAWFQGRSECGPRALGNRSIISSVLRANLKQYLNEKIKFREAFRPYGCSSIEKYAERYFELPPNFKNPYMSFAIRVKKEALEIMKEVSHIDGTSRMQIVTKEQNKTFYSLIEEFGKRTGIYCLANTSLNTMGEPIVETVIDAKNFLHKSDVDGLIIGDYFVTKN